MKYNRVIFVRYLPLTKKISEDFYFLELLQAGIEVEYWDVSFIKPLRTSVEQFECKVPIKEFKSYKEIRNELKTIDTNSSLFVSIMTYNGDVVHLYYMLSRFKCKIAVFGKNTFPQASFSYQRAMKSYVLTPTLIKKIILNKAAVYMKKYGIIEKYELMFLAGTNGVMGVGRYLQDELNKAKIVSINSDDYDRYLSYEKNPIIELDMPYVLFLDEYMPLHPDIEISGLRSVPASRYYSDINRMFDYVEKNLGMSVVIAAHPKAMRYHNEDFFCGRKVYWNKTLELCAKASLILAHDSTAINYAVAFKKPIVSLISEDIEKYTPETAASIKSFSSFLKTDLVYFDLPLPEKLHYKVDDESYQLYKYSFMTSKETENVFSKDIIINYIKS